MARLCESVMRPSSRRFDRKQGEGKPDQGVMAKGPRIRRGQLSELTSFSTLLSKQQEMYFDLRLIMSFHLITPPTPAQPNTYPLNASPNIPPPNHTSLHAPVPPFFPSTPLSPFPAKYLSGCPSTSRSCIKKLTARLPRM
jgi:hypothetical protein